MKMHPKRQLEIHEGSELFRAPRGETRRDQIGLSCLAVLGLLCHLLIFWLLSFPYVYTYNPYIAVEESSSSGFTSFAIGWQAPGSFILILPCLSYLACLLPAPRKSKWLGKSMSLNVFLIFVGFLLLHGSVYLVFAGDYDKQSYSVDANFGIHFALLCFAALCSCVCSLSARFWLRQMRKPR